MKTKAFSICSVLFSVLSVCIFFLAPVIVQTTEGLFNSYSTNIGLFDAISNSLIILCVVSGIALLLFSMTVLINEKGLTLLKIVSICYLLVQIIAIINASNYYNSSSLLGAIRSEVSVISIHPAAYISVILSLAVIIFAFKIKHQDTNQLNSSFASKK